MNIRWMIALILVALFAAAKANPPKEIVVQRVIIVDAAGKEVGHFGTVEGKDGAVVLEIAPNDEQLLGLGSVDGVNVGILMKHKKAELEVLCVDAGPIITLKNDNAAETVSLLASKASTGLSAATLKQTRAFLGVSHEDDDAAIVTLVDKEGTQQFLRSSDGTVLGK